jgi:fucose permease
MCSRWAVVLAYCGAFIGLGLTIASLGPVLLPLARQAPATVAEMGGVFAARSVGYLSGSFSGALFDSPRFDGNVIIAVSLLISGVGVGLTASGGPLWLLALYALAQGVGMGVLDTGANVMTLQLFRTVSEDADGDHDVVPSATARPVMEVEMAPIPGPPPSPKDEEGGEVTAASAKDAKEEVAATASAVEGKGEVTDMTQEAGMALQALHASFAIGGLVSPMILKVPEDATDVNTWRYGLIGIGVYCVCLGLGMIVWRVREVLCRKKSNVQSDAPGKIVHAASAILAASDAEVGGPVHRHTKLPREGPARSWHELLCTCTGSSGLLRWKLAAATAVLLGLYVGCEASYGGLLVAYAVVRMGITEEVGSNITSVYWAAMAVGRLFGICIARAVKPQRMLFSALLLATLAAIGLVISDSFVAVLPTGESLVPTGAQVSLFPLVAALGLGFSVVFPTAIAMAEDFVPLAGAHATAMVIGAAIGEGCLPLVVSSFFGAEGSAESGEPTALPATVLTALLLILMVFFLELQAGGAAKRALTSEMSRRRLSVGR